MTLKERHRLLFEAVGALLHELPDDLSLFTDEQRRGIQRLEGVWSAEVVEPKRVTDNRCSSTLLPVNAHEVRCALWKGHSGAHEVENLRGDTYRWGVETG